MSVIWGHSKSPGPFKMAEKFGRIFADTIPKFG